MLPLPGSARKPGRSISKTERQAQKSCSFAPSEASISSKHYARSEHSNGSGNTPGHASGPQQQGAAVLWPWSLKFRSREMEEAYAAFVQEQSAQNLGWATLVLLFCVVAEYLFSAFLTQDFAPFRNPTHSAYTIGMIIIVFVSLLISILSRFKRFYPFSEIAIAVGGTVLCLTFVFLSDHWRVAQLVSGDPETSWGRHDFSDGPLLMGVMAIILSICIFLPIRSVCLWPVVCCSVLGYVLATFLLSSPDGFRPSVLCSVLLIIVAYVSFQGRRSLECELRRQFHAVHNARVKINYLERQLHQMQQEHSSPPPTTLEWLVDSLKDAQRRVEYVKGRLEDGDVSGPVTAGGAAGATQQGIGGRSARTNHNQSSTAMGSAACGSKTPDHHSAVGLGGGVHMEEDRLPVHLQLAAQLASGIEGVRTSLMHLSRIDTLLQVNVNAILARRASTGGPGEGVKLPDSARSFITSNFTRGDQERFKATHRKSTRIRFSQYTQQVLEPNTPSPPQLAEVLEETAEEGGEEVQRVPALELTEGADQQGQDMSAANDHQQLQQQVMSMSLGAPQTHPGQSSVWRACEGIGREWNFDMFELTRRSNSNPVVATGMYVLEPFVKSYLKCDRQVLLAFLAEIQRRYQDNRYHNAQHGAEVCHSALWLAYHTGIFERISEVEQVALLMAALCHDVGHPGTNNAFQVAVRNDLALTYNDVSVLESFHAAQMFKVLHAEGLDFMDRAAPEDKKTFRSFAIELILETDMSKHFESIAKFKVRRQAAEFSLDQRPEDRWATAKMCIKAADIGHAAKAWPMHYAYSLAVAEEFYSQGDQEKRLGLTVSPLCDREKADDLPKSQVGFLQFVCLGLFQELAAVEQLAAKEQDLLDALHNAAHPAANANAEGAANVDAEVTAAACTCHSSRVPSPSPQHGGHSPLPPAQCPVHHGASSRTHGHTCRSSAHTSSASTPGSSRAAALNAPNATAAAAAAAMGGGVGVAVQRAAYVERCVVEQLQTNKAEWEGLAKVVEAEKQQLVANGGVASPCSHETPALRPIKQLKFAEPLSSSTTSRPAVPRPLPPLPLLGSAVDDPTPHSLLPPRAPRTGRQTAGSPAAHGDAQHCNSPSDISFGPPSPAAFPVRQPGAFSRFISRLTSFAHRTGPQPPATQQRRASLPARVEVHPPPSAAVVPLEGPLDDLEAGDLSSTRRRGVSGGVPEVPTSSLSSRTERPRSNSLQSDAKSAAAIRSRLTDTITPTASGLPPPAPNRDTSIGVPPLAPNSRPGGGAVAGRPAGSWSSQTLGSRAKPRSGSGTGRSSASNSNIVGTQAHDALKAVVANGPGGRGGITLGRSMSNVSDHLATAAPSPHPVAYDRVMRFVDSIEVIERDATGRSRAQGGGSPFHGLEIKLSVLELPNMSSAGAPHTHTHTAHSQSLSGVSMGSRAAAGVSHSKTVVCPPTQLTSPRPSRTPLSPVGTHEVMSDR